MQACARMKPAQNKMATDSKQLLPRVLKAISATGDDGKQFVGAHTHTHRVQELRFLLYRAGLVFVGVESGGVGEVVTTLQTTERRHPSHSVMYSLRHCTVQ